MVLDMLEAYHMKKVALNVKLFAIKVAKCKQSSIINYFDLRTKYRNCTNCRKITEAKDCPGN
jgi:hypothetical protein